MVELPLAAVHLWHFSLRATAPQAYEWLAPGEQQRYNRLRHPQAQQQFLAAHGALRGILAHYLALDPQELHLDTHPGGKPWLPECPELQFNLSHSHQQGILVVGWQAPLGVDLEWHRPCQTLAIARRCFSEPEVHWLEQQHPQKRLQDFFRLWTIREAWSKWLGRGRRAWTDLVIDPHTLTLANQAQHVIIIHTPPDYSGALVMNTPMPILTFTYSGQETMGKSRPFADRDPR
ncbi:MAG: 4'-phosphopantetheinyl transferase superfamily protein [Thermostichales cyanobacterium SZTDM-1c_bins_54]